MYSYVQNDEQGPTVKEFIVISTFSQAWNLTLMCMPGWRFKECGNHHRYLEEHMNPTKIYKTNYIDI